MRSRKTSIYNALRASVRCKEKRFRASVSAPHTDDPKISVEGVAPTNHSSCHKTRVNDLSCGICVGTRFFRFVTNHVFDRQTDGRTDRHLSRSWSALAFHAAWQKNAKVTADFLKNHEIHCSNSRSRFVQKTWHWRALFSPKVITGSTINKVKSYKNAKLPSPNVHCQTTFKNVKFYLFGIKECQLATLCYSSK